MSIKSNLLQPCSIGFLNVCSLRYKLDSVHNFLISEGLDILGIAESWLDDTVSDSEMSLLGYDFFRRDRLHRGGGGIVMYARAECTVTRRQELEPADLECIVLSLKVQRGHSITVACCYRPPSSSAESWVNFESFLDHLDNDNFGRVVIVGDLNDNLLGVSRPTPLRNILNRSHLDNHISTPTRVTATSSSLLDVALAHPNFIKSSNVHHGYDISDHYPISVLLEAFVDRPQATSLPFRRLRGIDWEVFSADLIRQDLDHFSCNDVDIMLEEWYAKIFTVLDRHAPLTVHRCKKPGSRPCPWLTPELKALVSRRKHLHRRLAKHPADVNLRTEYRETRSRAKRLERRLKNAYLLNRVEASEGNSRAIWMTLNQVMGRTKRSTAVKASLPALNNAFGDMVRDLHRTANLTDSIPAGPPLPESLSSFMLCTPDSVKKQLQTLDVTKATGHDGLPCVVLKLCAAVLSSSLATIFNTSLTASTMPLLFKKANISPLFKHGDPSLPSNYRPISLLPVVSRVLEKHVQSQLSQFLESQSLLPLTQFAYRRGHSTEDALTLATNRWLKSRHDHLSSGLVFVDMSKAFDCVSHEVLLRDLFDIGISGTALHWFANYLCDRYQRVKHANTSTGYKLCSRGVPQGSVLGPILFSIYIRNLSTCLPPQVFNQEFADDILLECVNKDTKIISNELSVAVTNLSEWLGGRGLKLNKRKTQVMLIQPSAAPHPDRFVVNCGDEALLTVPEARYLGVIVDDKLSWSSHVAHVLKSTKRSIGALWRARGRLSLSSKRLLYHSLIQSKLTYASNAIFPSLSQSLLGSLLSSSRSAIRAFGHLRRDVDVSPLFPVYNIRPLDQVMSQKVLVFVYRCLHHKASSLFNEHFIPVRGNRTRGASQDLLEIPFWRGPVGRSTIQFRASVWWNNLPAPLRCLPSLPLFCEAIRNVVIDHHF